MSSTYYYIQQKLSLREVHFVRIRSGKTQEGFSLSHVVVERA